MAPFSRLTSQGANLKRLRHAPVLLLGAMLLLVPHGFAQEPNQKRGSVKGTVSLTNASEERSTLEGLLLELKPLMDGSAALAAATDAAGNYEFKGVADGDYVLRLKGEGFEPFTATLHVQDGTAVVQNISVKLTGLTERVEVKEQVEPLSTTSSSATKLTEKQLESLPLAEENFKQVLPLTPGVVRTPDGKLNFRGSGEDQSMLQVNDSKMTDPVTGSFSIPVPLDAVQSVQVVKTPYSAENGGFSGALTEVETVPPPESWKFGVRDLNVSLRGKNDHFVGIARATPRITFGGPLLKDKISFSEVFEYDVIRDPIRGLTWPHNEIKRQGFNSYSTLQAILSPRHVLTLTLNVFPQRTQFANINPLLPQSASSDYDRKGESASLSDLYSFFSGALFHVTLTYTRFDSNAHGQGDETMLLTPEAWGGNYFNSWARSASQLEAAPTFQFAHWKFLGQHETKIGLDATHRSFSGSSLSRDVQLLREDGSLAEQIGFTGPGLVNAAVTDAEEFIADHWSLNDHLAVDLGTRLTSETIGRAASLAPRFGIGYSPGKDHKTVLRAGTGLFYAAVPLLAADFGGNPARIVSEYDPTGQIIQSQVAYQSAYVENGSSPFSSRIRRSPNSSARSFVTNAEIDRTLWSGAVLRLSYLYSNASNLFVINPIPGAELTGIGNPAGVLGLFNSGKEKYSEAEATLRFHPVKESELNISYVWSRSRGDLNTLGDLYIPFEQPVIRPNIYGVRPSDVPNRVVVWGRFRLPYSFILGPVVDVHTGFPYSKVDDTLNYVGQPNTEHFHTFFSVDFQVYRDFRMPLLNHSGSRKVRLGLYMINLTNHGNFTQVYNNVTSPQFGQFTGFERQKTAFLLSVVN
jgi:TonB-dependent receptor-like protein